MCGIAGILRTYPPDTAVPSREESIREAWLDILDDSIKHRGPDGAGRFRDRVVRADGTTVDVALIHRRMAIIDLAGGHQPMLLRPDEPDAPDQVVVVFNGCIYNHRELRKELEAEGARFRTDHSDTEVLLWGWRMWGRGVFERLEGMFAIGIWDRGNAQLVWATDRWSEKPAFVADYAWVYTSEAKAPRDEIQACASTVSALTLLRRELSHERDLARSIPLGVDVPRQWLRFGYGANGPTNECCQVAMGCQKILLDGKNTCVIRPWDSSRYGGKRRGTRDLCDHELDSLLRDAVHTRLDADVPLGVFLSGGVDSALVLKYASEVKRDVQAFTVRMPVGAWDESHAAAETARHLGVRHHILECEQDCANDLVSIIERAGQPFADSSLLPTLWLCRAARKHIRVALGGEGGDELFVGYRRQQVIPYLHALDRLPRWMRTAASGLLPMGINRPSLNSVARFLNALANDGYDDLLSIFPQSELLRLCNQKRDQNEPIFIEPSHEPGTHDYEYARYRDYQVDRWSYLPFDLLRKADIASMAAPLEVRLPFLDSRVTAAALSATRESLLLNGQRKGLLRAVAHKHLPSAIVDRPKMGFAIPLADWFRSDFGSLRTLLGDLVINAQDPFPADILGCELNRPFIRELFDQHMSGKRDHAQRLYALLVMAIWCRWYRRVTREAGGASGAAAKKGG